MKSIDEVKSFFETASSLYSFFKNAGVNECYEGTPLKRLIETRWSGHFDSVNHVNNNYSEITVALSMAFKSKKLQSEDKALATGLLTQMTDKTFPFFTSILVDILTLKVVNSVVDDLKEMRTNSSSEKFTEMVTNFKEKKEILTCDTRVKRNTSPPQQLRDYIITEHLHSDNTRNDLQIYNETLDLLIEEFDRRVSSDDTELWKAMESLSPKSSNFMDADTLEPLFDYCVTIPAVNDVFIEKKVGFNDFKAESRIFKRILANEFSEPENLVDIAVFMKKHHQETAPVFTKLYEVAVTTGWTSTICECLFSSLTRVDTPQRRSMKTERECNLSYLCFEQKVLMDEITFSKFSHAWKSKPRKL